MGCHKLTYHNQERALEVNPIFLDRGLGKKEHAEKNRVSCYRYGFNGQEKDDEIKGNGNSVNYKARIYDSRLGRFLSMDPLRTSYPMLTPYQFASNTPIWASDLDGLEANYETIPQEDGSTLIRLTIDLKVKNSSDQTQSTTIGQAFAIAAQIESSYAGYDSKTNTHFETVVHLDFESPIDENTDFYMEFVNDVEEPKGTGFNADGWTSENGNTNSNRLQILAIGKSAEPWSMDVSPERQVLTGAHEVGHALGLEAQENGNTTPNGIVIDFLNLMWHSTDENFEGSEINIPQLERTIDTIDENNNP